MAYMDKLVDDMVGHGITKEGDQRDFIAQTFGNRNAAWISQVLKYQRQRLDRGAAGITGTMDVDKAADVLLKESPLTNAKSMTSSWKSMLTALGDVTMGPAIQGMKDATDLFNFIRDPHTSSQWNALTGWKPEGPFHIDKIADVPTQATWWENNRAQSALGPGRKDMAGYPDANYKPGDLDREMSREAARGNALGAPSLGAIPKNISGALQAIPGQVQPAISAMGNAIAGSISAALAGVAASASRAAAAIPIGGGGQAVTVHTALHVDGKKLAEVVETKIVEKNRTAMSSARFDGGHSRRRLIMVLCEGEMSDEQVRKMASEPAQGALRIPRPNPPEPMVIFDVEEMPDGEILVHQPDLRLPERLIPLTQVALSVVF